MKLDRLRNEPGALADFFTEALEHLGAVCHRPWFDHLQLVAEGPAARLWNDDGALLETELHFSTPGDSTARDAGRDVFPGCPLTFRVAEAVQSGGLTLERAVLAGAGKREPPAISVAEKLWRAQRPGDSAWRLETGFVASNHFTLLALVRCEIQAIDQHWSLLRIAASLPGGERDELLTSGLELADWAAEPDSDVEWPAVEPPRLQAILLDALTVDMADQIASTRLRQEAHLRRELGRIDDYFEGYARETAQRAARAHAEASRLKADERLKAARAEHARRREDQIQRHEIRVIPHVDALVLIAEPAWEATVRIGGRGESGSGPARFVPRLRHWFPQNRAGARC